MNISLKQINIFYPQDLLKAACGSSKINDILRDTFDVNENGDLVFYGVVIKVNEGITEDYYTFDKKKKEYKSSDFDFIDEVQNRIEKTLGIFAFMKIKNYLENISEKNSYNLHYSFNVDSGRNIVMKVSSINKILGVQTSTSVNPLVINNKNIEDIDYLKNEIKKFLSECLDEKLELTRLQELENNISYTDEFKF